MRLTSAALGLYFPICTLLPGLPAAAQSLPPPIPGISVEIADVIKFPDTRFQATEDGRVTQNIARINFLRELPGATNRWFVNDLRGYLYMFDSTTGTFQTYLNLQSEFPRFRFGTGGLSTGMLTVTPHPEFATNGKFYTIHTEINTGSPTPDFIAQGNPGNLTGSNAMHEVILEWTAANPAANVFSGTRRELMRIAAPQGFLHGFGDLAFNPLSNPGDGDYGLLYIAGGDFGYDAYNKGTHQAQRMDSIYGKMLRIDPAGNNSANGRYGIPSINPFVGQSGAPGEIFAVGFRNAHRIMWDLETGVMFTTDIGQNSIEEINIVHPGANYGWVAREGTFTYSGGGISPLPPNDSTFGYTYPVVQYPHQSGTGNAIAGGFIYRGTMIPELQGKFVFGDIVRGQIWYSDVDEMIAADDGNPATTATIYELFLTRNGAPITLQQLILNDRGIGSLPSNRHDLRFGQTSDGEIYVMTKQDGWIRQLVGTIAPDELVLTVSRETGHVIMRNSGAGQVEIDGYSILSPSGSLNPANGAWHSFADQGLFGWEEANPLPTVLSELNADSSLIFTGLDSRSLGKAYAPVYTAFGTTGPEDLQFQYKTVAGEVRTGLVEYTGLDITNNLVLTVDPATGFARLKNASPFAVSIDGYSIISFSGALLPANGDWNSFADQGLSGWVEAAPTTFHLSELNPTSQLLLASGGEFDLGRIFNPHLGEQDLEFEFFIADAAEMLGIILYTPLTSPGDYNGDGTVDAADYILWRKTDGSPQGYETWRANFGATSGTGSSLASSPPTTVPEPAALAMLLTSMLALLVRGILPRSGQSFLSATQYKLHSPRMNISRPTIAGEATIVSSSWFSASTRRSVVVASMTTVAPLRSLK